MTTHKIAVLPGDGIGPEIVEQGIKILKTVEQKFGATFELEYALIGGAAIDTDGNTALSPAEMRASPQARRAERRAQMPEYGGGVRGRGGGE